LRHGKAGQRRYVIHRKNVSMDGEIDVVAHRSIPLFQIKKKQTPVHKNSG